MLVPLSSAVLQDLGISEEEMVVRGSGEKVELLAVNEFELLAAVLGVNSVS